MVRGNKASLTLESALSSKVDLRKVLATVKSLPQECSIKFESTFRRITFKAMRDGDLEYLKLLLRSIEILCMQNRQNGIKMLLFAGLPDVFNKIIAWAVEKIIKSKNDTDAQYIIPRMMHSVKILVPLMEDRSVFLLPNIPRFLELIVHILPFYKLVYKITSSLNDCLEGTNSSCLERIRRMVQDDSTHLKEALLHINLIGDIESQFSLVETVCHLVSSHKRPRFGQNIFSQDELLQEAFSQIVPASFEPTARPFINLANKILKPNKVISIECHSFSACGSAFTSEDQVWMDICFGSRKASFQLPTPSEDEEMALDFLQLRVDEISHYEFTENSKQQESDEELITLTLETTKSLPDISDIFNKQQDDVCLVRVEFLVTKKVTQMTMDKLFQHFFNTKPTAMNQTFNQTLNTTVSSEASHLPANFSVPTPAKNPVTEVMSPNARKYRQMMSRNPPKRNPETVGNDETSRSCNAGSITKKNPTSRPENDILPLDVSNQQQQSKQQLRRQQRSVKLLKHVIGAPSLPQDGYMAVKPSVDRVRCSPTRYSMNRSTESSKHSDSYMEYCPSQDYQQEEEQQHDAANESVMDVSAVERTIDERVSLNGSQQREIDDINTTMNSVCRSEVSSIHGSQRPAIRSITSRNHGYCELPVIKKTQIYMQEKVASSKKTSSTKKADSTKNRRKRNSLNLSASEALLKATVPEGESTDGGVSSIGESGEDSPASRTKDQPLFAAKEPKKSTTKKKAKKVSFDVVVANAEKTAQQNSGLSTKAKRQRKGKDNLKSVQPDTFAVNKQKKNSRREMVEEVRPASKRSSEHDIGNIPKRPRRASRGSKKVSYKEKSSDEEENEEEEREEEVVHSPKRPARSAVTTIRHSKKSPAASKKSPAVTKKSPAVTKKSPAVTKKSPAVAKKSPVVSKKSVAARKNRPVAAVASKKSSVVTKETLTSSKASKAGRRVASCVPAEMRQDSNKNNDEDVDNRSTTSSFSSSSQQGIVEEWKQDEVVVTDRNVKMVDASEKLNVSTTSSFSSSSQQEENQQGPQSATKDPKEANEEDRPLPQQATATQQMTETQATHVSNVSLTDLTQQVTAANKLEDVVSNNNNLDESYISGFKAVNTSTPSSVVIAQSKKKKGRRSSTGCGLPLSIRKELKFDGEISSICDNNQNGDLSTVDASSRIANINDDSALHNTKKMTMESGLSTTGNDSGIGNDRSIVAKVNQESPFREARIKLTSSSMDNSEKKKIWKNLSKPSRMQVWKRLSKQEKRSVRASLKGQTPQISAGKDAAKILSGKGGATRKEQELMADVMNRQKNGMQRLQLKMQSFLSEQSDSSEYKKDLETCLQQNRDFQTSQMKMVAALQKQCSVITSTVEMIKTASSQHFTQMEWSLDSCKDRLKKRENQKEADISKFTDLITAELSANYPHMSFK